MNSPRLSPWSPRLPGSVPVTMLLVLVALLPAVLVQAHYLGAGVLVQLALASLTALLVEAAVLRLRQRPLRPALADGSALVTAWLLALAMPPQAPATVVVFAVAFALLVAKHVYGGLGYNLFNPAMAGYAAALVSFPADMAQWPALTGMDALTAATPLDVLRNDLAVPVGSDLWRHLNLAYMAGGVVLVVLRVADLRIVAGVLLGAGVLAALPGAAMQAGVTAHLFGGATMACAFFIATDPVSAPETGSARLLYGLLIGAMTITIREHGGYPDGVAFAVLLGNACAPLLDRLPAPGAGPR